MSQKLEEQVYNATLGVLSSDVKGTLEPLLWEIIEHEKIHPPKTKYEGWEWFTVHGDPRTLNSLVIKRVLSVTLKTNKCTMYRASDAVAIEKALKDYQGMFREIEEEEKRMPPDLFDIVVGHESKIALLMRGLQSEKPVHFLLWGSPASAKSLILEELSRLPRSHFILGSSLTKVGIYEVLFNERPKYLLLDELDKIDSPSNLSALLSLMERGLISETKYRRHRQIRLKTWVMASANRIGKIPIELHSRFVHLRFKDYTPEEFTEVVTVILDREGINTRLALYIAQMTLQELRSKDVRDCIKITRLLKSKTRKDVDYIVSILRKQK